MFPLLYYSLHQSPQLQKVMLFLLGMYIAISITHEQTCPTCTFHIFYIGERNKPVQFFPSHYPSNVP